MQLEVLETRRLLAVTINEFPLPTPPPELFPGSITAGPDGNLWFTESGSGPDNVSAKIGMINPTTHAITEFSLSTTTREPGGITAGPDGNLWFTLSGSGLPNAGPGSPNSVPAMIGMINPATDAITEFPISSQGFVGNLVPLAITSGPDGNLWFAIEDIFLMGSSERSRGFLGQFNPTTHAIAVFPTPSRSVPVGITAGPDGNLWFTESDIAGVGLTLSTFNGIGMINPATHTIAEFPLPTANSSPGSITAGPDGNLWFTETFGNSIGMINPTSHAIAEFTVPTANSYSEGITAGPDGNLWFTESGAGKIGQVVLIAPTVLALQRFGFHAQPTTLVLTFSESLDPTQAENLSNYQLVKLRGAGRPGRTIRLRSAVYDPVIHAVTLTPARRLPLRDSFRLTVNGTAPHGLTSVDGVLLDGNGNGHPGSDFVRTFGRDALAG